MGVVGAAGVFTVTGGESFRFRNRKLSAFAGNFTVTGYPALFRGALAQIDVSVVYLYHPQNLATHTARLEGYRPIADGIVRVTGLKLGASR